jgi:hypothetical protein
LDKNLGKEFDHDFLRDLGWYINAATGRGNLGKLNQAAPILNTMFFSPRLMASRVSLMTMFADPRTWMSFDPMVRKEAAKDLLAFSSVALTTLGLMKAFGPDVEVSADPREADFGKIKIGNTRYDVLGGFQQYIRLGAQIITGETKTAGGKVKELGNPKDIMTGSRYDTILRFLRTKFSPVASFAVDAADNKNVIGEPFDVGIDDPSNPRDVMNNDLVERFLPFLAQSLADAWEEDGAVVGTAKVAPSVFGVGVQTYDASESPAKKAKAEAKETGEWWEDEPSVAVSTSKEWWDD